jgi:hypothetical protein
LRNYATIPPATPDSSQSANENETENEQLMEKYEEGAKKAAEGLDRIGQASSPLDYKNIVGGLGETISGFEETFETAARQKLGRYASDAKKGAHDIEEAVRHPRQFATRRAEEVGRGIRNGVEYVQDKLVDLETRFLEGGSTLQHQDSVTGIDEERKKEYVKRKLAESGRELEPGAQYVKEKLLESMSEVAARKQGGSVADSTRTVQDSRNETVPLLKPENDAQEAGECVKHRNLDKGDHASKDLRRSSNLRHFHTSAKTYAERKSTIDVSGQ